MFDPTLNGVMTQIDAGKIVLPAMQRPFVWKDERITKLIDSLLRGFPIGTALLWKTATMQRYRRFQKDVQPDAGISIDFENDDSSERYLVLDGQQRLTSLFVAIAGTYDGKRLFVDVLTGERGEKDAGDAYWDCRFLSEKEAAELNEWPRQNASRAASQSQRAVFIKFQDLTRLAAHKAGIAATQAAQKLQLSEQETLRMVSSYLQCATILASKTALQIHLIDEDAAEPMPIEEILEVFVRVNSGGLVLQKSDLLMSLLDLKWNDIQPELYRAVKDINVSRPFNITRDDVLKSLLIAKGSETRFDRLVADRVKVESLASELPGLLPAVQQAWKSLTLLLMDDCKITSERFFRGGHNSLLPFVQYFALNPNPNPAEKRRLVVAVYVALMTGIFTGAEARMGTFARKQCVTGKPFPLDKLAQLVKHHYGIGSLEALLSRHLDLTLNIAHGGITLDNNPENLQRDHIFPRATLTKQGMPSEQTNHYANFHFLRGKDNLNKSDTPPSEWFRKPGEQPPYSEDDLKERLLSWELLEPESFPIMLRERTKEIHDRALRLFGVDANGFERLFGPEAA
ncbi:hypothetical protein LMG28614_04475 [Paraburkholderia ultramafica]|uniref:GmrSD restriction endonucleases N-terminal domain-containing protein n=1 Tax=Paraburkholderia ultramafica TaxID=1544867 RepID=A0A6S7BEM5_9BURK|nr:DUF262 domain-containing protein [Paraburkholderia ultramafica]CAB3796934.1 hypothetical protein LMG28614_04475 [Paraburkholderia ultramafica]